MRSGSQKNQLETHHHKDQAAGKVKGSVHWGAAEYAFKPPHCAQSASTYVMQGDAGNKEFLAQNGVTEMDAAIVSTGDRSHLATLITLHLVELGLPRVLVKAVDEDHGHILSRVGASDVIYPEKDMAVRTARSLANPTFLEALPLMDDYTLLESAPPQAFIGKTLIELNLRNRFEVSVIAIRDVLTGDTQIMPAADRVLKDMICWFCWARTKGWSNWKSYRPEQETRQLPALIRGALRIAQPANRPPFAALPFNAMLFAQRIALKNVFICPPAPL